jgi:GT2 family glycosyltransferase
VIPAVPHLSVIVPAHNASTTIRSCLEALAASDVDRRHWEMIVVNDASSDASEDIAREYADTVISTGTKPRGPAYARNRGAEAATGEILVFVDSDVIVHADALRRMRERLADKSLAAVFGSYDDNPAERSRISQYRNLLHHYAHQESAGNVPTFWAGCGAVRRSAFTAVNGFDELRYPRPQIEDIELGYRLSEAAPILLDPEIQGTHLKRWTLGSMIRTDLLDRAIPWTRLLLGRGPGSRTSTPSLGLRAVIGTASAGLAVAALALAAVTGWLYAIPIALFSFATSIVLNARFYAFLRRRGGLSLALAAVPLHFFYQLLSAVAVPIGLTLRMLDGGRNPRIRCPDNDGAKR